MTKNQKCSVDDCDGTQRSKNLCEKHYRRFLKHGTTEIATPVFSSPEEAFSYRTKRDGECLIWTGSMVKGYGRLRVAGKMMLAHRFSWEMSNGPIPDGAVVDHKYHCNTSCVEPSHLRLASIPQNVSNRAGPNKSNTGTGVRNVYKNHHKFVVRVKGEYLGSYSSLEEARKVATEYRNTVFKDFSGED